MFYGRLNGVLDEARFDREVEALCATRHARGAGRPSVPPGRYCRMLLVGYFEGLESERGIAWRCADSLSLRQFLKLGTSAAAPDHSTLSRTRRGCRSSPTTRCSPWCFGSSPSTGW